MGTKEKEKLLTDMLMANASVSWFQSQIKQVVQRIEELESLGSDCTKEMYDEYEELRGKLSYLLGKGLFENKLIKHLKQRIIKIK